ncbi:cobalamin (vitamin B12) biosynthesis CbiG protein [Calothrix sp. NIES-4071]|nr:cobalamin (vitamin B12) biosynthesis CbiG protein [Calothrix sp. NIES-4071]BAZ62306.1 cobalamin (vitamin B12) biosynthesis CbiG protein [Calothrix sp. NIES-4105]
MSHQSNLWVGIGCQRGTECKFIEAAIKHVFQENNLSLGAIAGVATIDSKANEAGLIEYCYSRNLPLIFFTAEELQNVNVPNPSQIVGSIVQTLSVAEAAAILAASVKTLHVTSLRVPKQIIRSVQDLKGAVTLAVSWQRM